MKVLEKLSNNALFEIISTLVVSCLFVILIGLDQPAEVV